MNPLSENTRAQVSWDALDHVAVLTIMIWSGLRLLGQRCFRMTLPA